MAWMPRDPQKVFDLNEPGMTFEAYSIGVPNHKQVRSLKMKQLISSIAALALIISGAAWAGEMGESQGSQAKKPFKSSETMVAPTEAPSSQAKEKQQTKGQESKQSTVGEYMDDTMITTKVKAALATDPGASALAISVETTKGTVQLSGSVDSADEKMKAESIARGVEGVREVENKLTVK